MLLVYIVYNHNHNYNTMQLIFQKHVLHYVITVVAFIVWIVYITDTNIHKIQLKNEPLKELAQKEKIEVAVVTPLDPKELDPTNNSTSINDAIDRVGFLCCLTTMLFFAAPLSNLVILI